MEVEHKEMYRDQALRNELLAMLPEWGMIEDFGGRGKIFAVHFRNVSAPLPVFHETFQDDGYMDMYQVMKALRQVKCTASLIPDHYPTIVNDPGHRIADTYSITYMRSLLRRANEEVG